MSRWLIRILVLGLLICSGGVAFSLYVGSRLVAPVPRTVGGPPVDFPAASILIPSTSGSDLRGWLAVAPTPVGSLLLLHGVRADRRSMLERARFLYRHSYHILLIDFQAHGESPGSHLTMGYLESLDAIAALQELRRRFPDLPIGVIGSSLGGAATILANIERPPDAVILEAVYTDVTTAVNNRLRMRFGSFGNLLTPLLTYQLGPRLGVSIDDLSPVTQISDLKSPILLIYGDSDRHATLSEGRQLYNAASQPKALWIIEGAAHVDFHRFSGKEYEQRILSFLQEHLQKTTNQRVETSGRSGPSHK